MGLTGRAFYESEISNDKMVKLQHYAVSNRYLENKIGKVKC